MQLQDIYEIVTAVCAVLGFGVGILFWIRD